MAVTQAEYLAQIAREEEANARARAEGYESAAHKEAAANFRRAEADPNAPDAAEYERLANIRAEAAGFANAAEQEMDANRRSIDAGFTSAVDQEIDANRRAREAGYLNAADYESGLRTRSDAPFLDPRLQPAPVIPDKFALGTANLLKYNPDQPNVPGYDPNWRNDPKYAGGFDVHGNPITGGGGPPNPTVPSFGYPQYQDWTRFMPTNFGLAEGGGMHYQPGAWPGTGGGGGGGGTGGGLLTSGGGTTATGGPGPINPNIWGAPNANVNTTGVRPGSDKANDLAAGRTHHPQMYDANDNWVGAEATDYGYGGGTVELNPMGQIQWGGNKSLPDFSKQWWGGLEKMGSAIGTAQDALASKLGLAAGGGGQTEAEIAAEIAGSGPGMSGIGPDFYG